MSEIQLQENQTVFIYSTFPNIEEAEAVGRTLVEENLVACANIYPGMISIYKWVDKIERGREVGAIFKTRKGVLQHAMNVIVQLHSYDIPAVVSFAAEGGSMEYCDWITSMTGGEILLAARVED